MFSALIVTLPSRPTAVRVRTWRALKALGCAALRDGAYLLPADKAVLFEPLATDVRQHHGTAEVLLLQPRDDVQRDALLALFDRTAAYAGWRDGATELQRALPGLAETEARRRLRALADALQGVQRSDHYPSSARQQADEALSALRQALDDRYSPGEPQALPAHGIARLDRARFQGRRWATRARPWVDRLACAWLIRRHIDPQAQLMWLAASAPVPRGALGYDFDGARFSHVGARVTFEVLCASFGLDADPKLQRLGAVVHYLDAGGIPAPEAVGLESVLSGLRALHADDDDLAAAAALVFDALHAAPGVSA
jgi:hypothetical protein